MFCLSAVGSVLSCDYFPPIDLGEGEWELGLVGFTTYNSIPNVETGVNDKFYYGEDKEITINEGSYEIEDLEKYILSQLGESSGVTFSLKPNNNTLKTELMCSEQIRFDKPNSIGEMLGFKNSSVLAANVQHTSDSPVSIIKVNAIRVECNVVRGSYDNGAEGHIIHEFYPSCGPGFKIVENPGNIIYLPLNVRRVSNLTVQVKDQEGRLINFRNEQVSLRLHIRQRHGSGI